MLLRVTGVITWQENGFAKPPALSGRLALLSWEQIARHSYCALSMKLSHRACFCLRKRKWHIRVFKYIWTPAGNCYRVEKERGKRLAESKRLWFFSFLLPTELEESGRLTCSFHFQGANLQLKTCYHYIKNISEAHTRTRNSILHVQSPLVGGGGEGSSGILVSTSTNTAL